MSNIISLCPLSDVFVRFAIITAVAVVWCSLSIPVEGLDNEVDEAEENLSVEEKCSKAIQDVYKDSHDLEMMNRFLHFCKEFIDKMDLTETHIAILEKAGYRRSKTPKSKKAEEDEIGGEEVTDKEDEAEDSSQPDKEDNIKDPSMSDKEDEAEGSSQPDKEDNIKDPSMSDKEDEAEGSSQPDKEDNIKDTSMSDKEEAEGSSQPDRDDNITDPSISDKQDEGVAKTQEVPAEKVSEAGVEDSVTREEDNTMIEKEDGEGEGQGTETLSQDENISELRTDQQAPDADSKSQEKQSIENEQVQQNLKEDIPSFDFTKFHVPGMTPEELAQSIEELKEIRRMMQMEDMQQMHAKPQMHASFPDPVLQGIHEPQFGQQFGQGIPQFGQQLGQGIPQFGQQLGQDIPQFGQQLGQDIPQFQYHDWDAQFQDPGLAEDILHMHFDQRAGIPDPVQQQEIPPFPHQAEFAGHFQHQHFGQDIPQTQPSPEGFEAFPEQEFAQDAPLPNNAAAGTGDTVNEAPKVSDQQQATHQPNVAPTNEKLFMKRHDDEL